MLPNVETTADPLNVDALPPTAGMELDYRTEPFNQRLLGPFAVWCLLLGCLVGMALALGSRIAGSLTSSYVFLAAATVLGVTVALMRFVRDVDPWAFVVITYGPIFWLLSIVTRASWLVVLFLIALACAMRLAERMTNHYARWLHANPYLTRDVRQRWRSLWPETPWYEHVRQAIIAPPPKSASADPLVAAERRERFRYHLGFAMVIAAYLLSILVYVLCQPSLLAGFLAVASFTISLSAYGIASLLTYDHPVPPALIVRILRDAAVSWFMYNVQHTQAAGVFQSPSGRPRRRYFQSFVTLVIVAVAVLPVASYFPIGLLLFGRDPFIAAAATPMPWDGLSLDDLFSRTTQTPRRASSSADDIGLSDEQHRYLKLVPEKRRKAVEEELRSHNRAVHAAAIGVQRLFDRPEAMLWVYIRGAINLDARMIFSVLLAFLGCLLGPPALIGAVWLAVGGRVLVHHYLMLEGDSRYPARYHPCPRPHLWDAYTRRLRDSQFVSHDAQGRLHAERDQFLIGFAKEGDYPVLLSPHILGEHAHITGDSGAGKSSLGLAPLLTQIIDRGEDSVVIFDLKGDMPLFQAARLAVEKSNRGRSAGNQVPFRWFTNRPDAATYAFNPFLQDDLKHVTTHQKVEILIKSMGLEHGEGYGASYFSSAVRFVLDRIFAESGIEFSSFRQLNEYLAGGFNDTWKELRIRPRLRDDATHLYTAMNALASVDALNVTTEHGLPGAVLEQRLDMGHVVRSPHVVYFYMHSAFEEAAVRAVAKLAMHSLLVAATRRGPASHRVYVVVDEFQQVVSEDLQIFLRQARSAKIPVILANQTLSDLKTRSVDLIPTVQGNTRFRQVFSASDLFHQNMIIEGSGEVFYDRLTRRTTWPGGDSVTTLVEGAEIGPRLRRNDVIQASDNELASIVHVTRSHGFTQFHGFPLVTRSMFPMSLGEYLARERSPWPRQGDHPGTFIPPLPDLRHGATRTRGSAAPGPPPAASTHDQNLLDLEKAIDQLEETY